MHDLIERIEDIRQRERLRQVWEESIREKKFGLVFEPHLPELLPLPNVKAHEGLELYARGFAQGPVARAARGERCGLLRQARR